MTTTTTAPIAVSFDASQIDPDLLREQDRVPATYVKLSQFEIIELWERGILNDLAFIYFALKYENLESPESLEKLNIDRFLTDWRGTTDDRGKCKEVKRDQFFSAIAKLEKKEELAIGIQQLSLEFN